jgi:hypothetical protein
MQRYPYHSIGLFPQNFYLEKRRGSFILFYSGVGIELDNSFI